MKRIVLTASLCFFALPAFAVTGGLAPGQTLTATGQHQTFMTPGTAVSTSGIPGTTTATSAFPATTTTTTTTTIPTATPSLFDFQHRKDEKVASLQQHIAELQTRIQCIQGAMDEAGVLACERETTGH